RRELSGAASVRVHAGRRPWQKKTAYDKKTRSGRRAAGKSAALDGPNARLDERRKTESQRKKKPRPPKDEHVAMSESDSVRKSTTRTGLKLNVAAPSGLKMRRPDAFGTKSDGCGMRKIARIPLVGAQTTRRPPVITLTGAT
ncbi:hypothetical protein KC352_g47728, partial [Hortaea werneckii]